MTRANEYVEWMDDTRPILYIVTKDGREWHVATGYVFERIQYAGHMCYVPWIRITRPKESSMNVTEIPLEQCSRIDLSPTQEG